MLFLQSLASNSTFAVVMGDQGLNYATYAQTQHGRFEANNPVLLVLAPQPLLAADAAWHLYKNQRELVTPLDLHATFLDLLAMNLPEAERGYFRNTHAENPRSVITIMSAQNPRSAMTIISAQRGPFINTHAGCIRS